MALARKADVPAGLVRAAPQPPHPLPRRESSCSFIQELPAGLAEGSRLFNGSAGAGGRHSGRNGRAFLFLLNRPPLAPREPSDRDDLERNDALSKLARCTRVDGHMDCKRRASPRLVE